MAAINTELEEEERPRTYRFQRRTLTYQRKVNGIDEALNPVNYDVFNVPAEIKEITSVYKNNKEPDIEYKFRNQPPSRNGRQRRTMVISNQPGPTAEGAGTELPFDAFIKLFTPEMLRIIVESIFYQQSPLKISQNILI